MSEEHDDWDEGAELLPLLRGNAERASLERQDKLVAEAAAATAERLESPGWRMPAWPVALAAGLLAGAVLAPMFTTAPSTYGSPSAGGALFLPADVTRAVGADASAQVPVADAEPALWYRYIQELVYRGDFAMAEQHLRAFNELHPDYRSER